MFKTLIKSFRQYSGTKQFVRLVTLLGMLLLAFTVFYKSNWIGKRTNISSRSVASSIESMVNEHKSRCTEWNDTPLDDLYLERLWQAGYNNSQYDDRVSIFLFERDSMVYWSYVVYNGDVSPMLCDVPPTLFEMDSSQVVCYNFTSDAGATSKKGSLVINLYHPRIGFNPYIFDRQNISLYPYRDGDDMVEGGELVEVEGVKFVVQPDIRTETPLAVTIVGWIGVLLILLSIRRYARLRTARLNSLTASVVVMAIFLAIRLLLRYFDIPGFPGTEHPGKSGLNLSSVGELLVSFVFVFIYMAYLFSVRYKIKWRLLHYSKTVQFLIFLAFIVFADIIIIYFHYSGVNIVYNGSINAELYNIYSVNSGGILFYVAAGFFFAVRIFTSRVGSTCFSQHSFMIKSLTSIILLVVLLISADCELHNSGYLLVIFHGIFLGVTLFRNRFKYTVFILLLALAAAYITCFMTIENAAMRDSRSEEYSHLLIEYVEELEKPAPVSRYLVDAINDPRYSDITYTIFTGEGIETKAGNTVDVPKLWEDVPKQDNAVVVMQKYRHFIKQDGDTVVVTSHARTSLLSIVTLFIYIFVLLYIIVTPLLKFARFDPRKDYGTSRLAVRIRTVLIGVIFLTMSIIVIVVMRYSSVSYANNQRQVVNDAGRSILRNFNTYAHLYHGDKEHILNDWYANSGSSFDLVISLYDTDGVLINTPTRRTPLRIGSEAYRKLKWKDAPLFVRIYETDYESYSAASMQMKYKGELVGYLRYLVFDTKGRQSDPIFSLLNDILNVFVIILSLSLLMSLFLYRKITDPLKQVNEALRNVAQMQKIPIDQSRQISDEVGELAHQYNKMIDYIEESYQQLARSEREGAWREMALQVAHEIKNPLTPMRLKIQMLQRARQNDDPALLERLDSALNTMMEQVDMLSNIATDFSDFARLSGRTPKHINLGNMLRNVSELYTTYDNIEVRFLQDSSVPVFVNADYQQLSRVIINLYQNAIQAIGTNFGLITIRLGVQGAFAHVEVTDNGGGIPAEIRSKIFLPNFTTKSSGSGLGLAISQEILKSIGATIEFDSIVGIGTTFTIKIPVV